MARTVASAQRPAHFLTPPTLVDFVKLHLQGSSAIPIDETNTGEQESNGVMCGRAVGAEL